MWRGVSISAVLALVVASCGGGDGTDSNGGTAGSAPPGDSEAVIVSDDGNVELVIPEGALRDGTDVSITAADAPPELSVEGAETFVYRLEPSGLQFDSPARVVIRVPVGGTPGITLAALALADGPGGLEHLPASHSTSDGELTIESELSHFSELVGWVGGEKIEVVDTCRDGVEEGQTCSLSVPAVAGDRNFSADFEGPTLGTEFVLETADEAEATYRCVSETGAFGATVGYVEVFSETYLLDVFLLLSTGVQFQYKGGDRWTYASRAVCTAATTTTSGGDAVDIPGGIVSEGTDPTGDFIAEEDLLGRGFELIEDDPPAGIDITDVSVVYAPDGTQTVITVCFAGDALSLEADESRSVIIRDIFRSGGEYLFELHYENGGGFLSSAPPGVDDFTAEWIADNKIRFTIDGFVPLAGDSVRVEVFSRFEIDGEDAVQGDEATVEIQ